MGSKQASLCLNMLGEIAIGIIFGTPLTGTLDSVWEQTFLSLGYIGLLLIVFEGGLTTPLKTLIRSLPLATLVALTGILVPIALSFLLVLISSISPLEALAAGSSLSSTSLGTTFVVLKAVGGSVEKISPGEVEEEQREGEQAGDGDASKVGRLEKTRLGTVLAGAAVFDDDRDELRFRLIHFDRSVKSEGTL
ncbi:hypothetical protein BDY24DRAFT_187844 [Mrakia frigida]|uniref:uncharacterized protein n=1 Tax=Mrakia frigida TaxID=29902 RepID=UPI003FCC21DF